MSDWECTVCTAARELAQDRYLTIVLFGRTKYSIEHRRVAVLHELLPEDVSLVPVHCRILE